MNLKAVKVGAGRTSTLFRYGEDRIVKLFRANFPQQAINEEFKIGLSLNTIGLSIPKTYELVNIEGSTAIIFDYVDGNSMLQSLGSKPWMVESYAKRMAKLHHEIHQAKNIEGVFIRPLKESLAEKISRVPLLNEQEKTTILSQLSNLQDGSVLCHGDFHPDNIIMSKNRLVTVDWITACIGHPLADVARTWLLLTMGTLPEGKSAIELFLAKHLRDLFCRIYLKEYSTLSNITHADLQCWKIPVAAARLIENVSEQENQNILRFIRTALNQRC